LHAGTVGVGFLLPSCSLLAVTAEASQRARSDSPAPRRVHWVLGVGSGSVTKDLNGRKTQFPRDHTPQDVGISHTAASLTLGCDHLDMSLLFDIHDDRSTFSLFTLSAVVVS
jgi:hypothetical protein